MSMWVSFLAIPESVFPLDQDGPEVESWEYSEPVIHAKHECCGSMCDNLRSDVVEIPIVGREGGSANSHVFYALDDLTNGLLVELMGEYESGRLRRLHLRSHLLPRLRACLDTVRNAPNSDFLVGFLTSILDTAEKALAEQGKQAVIWNR